MKSRLFAVALALALVLGSVEAVGAQVPDQAAGIVNYKRLHARLAAGGSLSAEAMRELKAMGFQTVVDLRTEAEGTLQEKAAVEALGLRYVSVPISPATFTLDDAKAVANVLADPASGPVLLHCASSNRVGAVYGVVQRLEGKTLAEAEAAAREAGLKSGPMAEAMIRVAAEIPPRR
jgi:uncharacterized protein (TIGR01244 family)